MADWLRPVFAKTKTPATSFSARQSPFSDERGDDGDISRLRPTSRVSSYMNMNIRSSTPPIPQTPDSFANIRSPERVYHKPSVDHMAETLKVVMMTQSSMDPVPITYNGCILHVLEAYHDLRLELAKKESFIGELKQSHAKDIEDFEALATQWEMKEQDYKTELKKLEILLSQTDGGMEKVTLARSKSKVHGSGAAAESIGRGISTLKGRNSGRNGTQVSPQLYRPGVKNNWPLGKQNALQSTEAAVRRPSTTQLYTNILHSSGSSGSQASMTSFRQPASERVLKLTRSSLDALEQQQADGEYGMTFDSSTSEPSTQSSGDEKASMESRIGLGIDLDEKPLPRIPSDHERDKSGQTASGFDEALHWQRTASSGSLETSHQMGFSFRPGDDAGILGPTTTRNLKTRSMVGARLYQMRPASSDGMSAAPNTTLKSAEGTWHLKSPLSTHKPKLQSKPGRDPQDHESLQRDDSTSSIITAIRDSSGRSSVDSSRQSSQGGGQKLSRNSGSNEAITAAARALASASATTKNSSSTASNPGTREESTKGAGAASIDAREDVSKKSSVKTNSSRSEF